MSLTAQEETLSRYAKYYVSYALEKGDDIDELDVWEDFQETSTFRNGCVNIFAADREAYIEAHHLVETRKLAVKKFQQAGEIERRKKILEIQSNPTQAVSELRYGVVQLALEELALAADLLKKGGRENIKSAIELKKSANATLAANDRTLLEYLNNGNLPVPDDLALQVLQASRGSTRQRELEEPVAEEVAEPKEDEENTNVLEVSPLEREADVAQVVARRIFGMPDDPTPVKARPKIQFRHKPKKQ